MRFAYDESGSGSIRFHDLRDTQTTVLLSSSLLGQITRIVRWISDKHRN